MAGGSPNLFVQDLAQEIFKDVYDRKLCRSRKCGHACLCLFLSHTHVLVCLQTRGYCHRMRVCCHTCPWNPANAQRCANACISEPVLLQILLCLAVLAQFSFNRIQSTQFICLLNCGSEMLSVTLLDKKEVTGVFKIISRDVPAAHTQAYSSTAIMVSCDDMHTTIQLYLHYNNLFDCINTCRHTCINP